MAYKSSKKSWFQQVKEIEKCNLLRARIKTYVAQQGVTQKSFAEKIKVTEKQLQRFMSGTSLTGSEVYTRSMAFLKTKLPAAAVSVDILENTHNNKYEFKSKTDDFVLRV
jgi:transcriptional regulator with XRE-family HTH domain